MPHQLDASPLDHAGRAAIAAALGGARVPGAAFQAFVRVDRLNLCVNAVEAPAADRSGFSDAAARRAATRGRRLLPVVDAGELEGRVWIAYDMDSTTPLADHRKHLVLPTATCLRLLADVAHALDEAADDGVFPYEVGPESVFVSKRGARLGDLGCAREAFGDSVSGSDTAFVSPEVLRGDRAAERSVVYVFGALLYDLLAGASPRGGGARSNGGGAMVPLAGWRPDLPAAIDSVVAAAMAVDPRRRPRSAGEAYDLARQAIRGEGPARAAPAPAPPRSRSRREHGRRDADPPGAGLKLSWSDIAPEIRDPKAERPAPTKPSPPERETPVAKPAPTEPSPRHEEPAPTKPSPRPPEPAPARSSTPARKLAFTKPSTRPDKAAARRRKAASPKPAPRHRRDAIPLAAAGRVRSAASSPGSRRWLQVVALGGAVVVGAALGLLLGGSPDPAPARAKTVSAAGMGITLPPDWEAAGSAGTGVLAARAQGDPGTRLEARLVDERLERQESAEPVRLGTLQAWRSAAPGAVRYAAPTTAGTLIVTCQASTTADAGLLPLCERSASTLTLGGASPLPLAGVVEEEDRLRAAIAALRASRDAGRRRLARAVRPSGQRAVARALARSHRRAAGALAELSGAEPIEAAVREAATAYSALAKAAASGASARWQRARERVRRRDATLAEALAARG
jgi:hypothetical protein